MDLSTVSEFLQALYSRPRIRAARITCKEKSLGPFLLTPDVAWFLGTNEVGVFVGNSHSLESTTESYRHLEDDTPDAPVWVFVAESKKSAAFIVHSWFPPEAAKRIKVTRLRLPQMRSNLIVCTPETLSDIPKDATFNIAGIFVLDPVCHIHKLRSFKSIGSHSKNDLPQLIANFRNLLRREGWAPPLFILTQNPAKSVWTDDVARVFCLNALFFLDGRSVDFCDDV